MLTTATEGLIAAGISVGASLAFPRPLQFALEANPRQAALQVALSVCPASPAAVAVQPTRGSSDCQGIRRPIQRQREGERQKAFREKAKPGIS